MQLPEFLEAWKNDMPMDKFELELPKKRLVFEQFITNWRCELETRLISDLPEGTCEPDFNVPGLILTTGGGEPITSLPLGIQKLLRADATMLGPHFSVNYFPDDFSDTNRGFSTNGYNPGAASIARALLHALGRPDATYLELKALGCVFQCGRCHASAKNQTWEELVSLGITLHIPHLSKANTSQISHYLQQVDDWDRVIRHSVCSAENFTYVFTHDVTLIDYHKPLVQIRFGEPKIPHPYVYNPHKTCKLCQSVRIPNQVQADFIAEHLLDV